MAWEVPKDFKRHSFDTEGFLGSKPFWGRFWEAENATTSEREALTLIRNNIIESLSKLPKDMKFFWHGSCRHAFAECTNSRRKKLSVIDFDDAGFGWYGFDLAVAIWDRLDFTATGCHFDIAYESLIKGYLRGASKR